MSSILRFLEQPNLPPILSSVFPIDDNENGKIQNLQTLLQQIPADNYASIKDHNVTYLDLHAQRISVKIFKAAQKVLCRASLDSLLHGEKKALIKKILEVETIFTSVLIEEAKQQITLPQLFPLLVKVKDIRRELLTLCLQWSDNKHEFRTNLQLAEHFFSITLLPDSANSERKVDLDELAKNLSLFSITPHIDKVTDSIEDKFYLLQCYSKKMHFKVFEYLPHFPVDWSTHRGLLLELAQAAAVQLASIPNDVSKPPPLYVKEFWKTIPFTDEEKKALFHCLYSSLQGRAELFAHSEYFGWDNTRDRESLFNFLKEPTELTRIPDHRPFEFTPNQRLEIAKTYVELIGNLVAIPDMDFFNKLPLYDIEIESLLPLLQKNFIKHPAFGLHLHKFSLSKELKLQLIKQCILYSNSVLQKLDQMGLDPIADKEFILFILPITFKNDIEFNCLTNIFRFFSFTSDEIANLLKILAKISSKNILENLGCFNLTKTHVHEIVIIYLLNLHYNDSDVNNLIVNLSKLELSKTQNIEYLEIILQKGVSYNFAKHFNKFLTLLGLDFTTDKNQIFELFKMAITHFSRSTILDLFPQIEQHSFSQSQLFELIHLCVMNRNAIIPCKLLDFLILWKIDLESNSPEIFTLFLALAYHQPINLLKKQDFFFTSDQKIQIFERCLQLSSKALDYSEYWVGDITQHSQEKIYSWMKMGASNVGKVVELLSLFPFNIDERIEMLQLCLASNIEDSIKNIQGFQLTETEYVKAFRSAFFSQSITYADLPHWITIFPISTEKKIELLIQTTENRFIKSMEAVDGLHASNEQVQKYFAEVASQVLKAPFPRLLTMEFNDLNHLQTLLFLCEKYNPCKDFVLSLVPLLLTSYETNWVWEHLPAFGINFDQDCEAIVKSLKQSSYLIVNVHALFQKIPLTKEQQISILVQQATLKNMPDSSAVVFLHTLMNCHLRVEQDRDTILYILHKWFSNLYAYALPPLNSLTFLSHEERKALARTFIHSSNSIHALDLTCFGLDWALDRAFMLEQIHDRVRFPFDDEGPSLLHYLHKFPLTEEERQKIALIHFSSIQSSYPIEDLHLVGWDPVKHRKEILLCWKQTAKYNIEQLITHIERFPYGKQEKIAFAKISARSDEASLLFPRLLLFDLNPADDQNTLFEIAVLLCHNPSCNMPSNQIIQKLKVSLDKQKTDLLQHISLLSKENLPEPECTKPVASLAATPFSSIIEELQLLLAKHAEAEWIETANQLLACTSGFLEGFAPFFTDYLLDSFVQSSLAAKKNHQNKDVSLESRQQFMQNFAGHVHKTLHSAMLTPNRQVKNDVLSLLFIPLLVAFSGTGAVSLAQTIEAFNLYAKKASSETAMIGLYLFGLFHGQNEAKRVGSRIDKLYNSLTKPEKIQFTKTLLGFLQALYANKDYSLKKKWKLFRFVFSNSLLEQIDRAQKHSLAVYVKTLEKDILLASVIAQCPVFKDFIYKTSPPPLNQYIEQKVLDLLPKDLTPDEMQTIYRFWVDSNEQVSLAFFSYCASLDSLSNMDKQKLLPLWKDFLLATAQGLMPYRTWRYESLAKSVHWQSLLPFAQVLARWKESIRTEISCANLSTKLPDYTLIFRQKIIYDSHLKGVDILSAYLRNEKLDFSTDSTTNPASLAFQKKAIDFLTKFSAKELTTPKECKMQLETLKNLLARFSPASEFMHDLQGLISSLQRNRSSQTLSAIVTDAPLYMFRTVNEVPGSCQRQDGDPNLNKCLLGYLCNPYIKTLVLEDQTKTLQSRAMLKLLLNEKDDSAEPVLFLERPYPPQICEEEVQLLWKTAKDFADNLQIPLMANDESYNKVQPARIVHNQVTLTCKGGVTPYEYSDANRKVTEGSYTIFNAFYWVNETTKEI